MVIRIDYLIYVYMTLCLCMLAYNLFYLGKNKWMQRRTEKQIQNQARRLQRFLLFPEKTSSDVDEKIKKKLKRTHQLVILEGTVETLEQNPLTVKPLQAWLLTLKPVFTELIDVYMKKSVMERSYFAYLVTRFGLCGQTSHDPIASAMIQLTAVSSIYCRENALTALYAHGSIEQIVKAYRVMALHEIEHSRKMATGNSWQKLFGKTGMNSHHTIRSRSSILSVWYPGISGKLYIRCCRSRRRIGK